MNCWRHAWVHASVAPFQEHHLQAALSAQQVYGTSEVLVIPIPEVEELSQRYDGIYKDDFKTTKQFIHIQGKRMCIFHSLIGWMLTVQVGATHCYT